MPYLNKIANLALLISIVFCSTAQAKAKIIKEQRSLYRNIFVEDDGDIRCLKFSVKRRTSSQSCINKKYPNKMVFNYTKFALSSLIFYPQPKRVLIIGLGGGTLSNSLLQLYPEIKIDNVEIDQAVVDVARDYFDFKETDNVKTYMQDGRIFIKRALMRKDKYDVVILDAFNGEYIPEHLMTKEFLEETKGLLTEQGIVVANTFSSSELYHYESATYREVFGDFYTINKSKTGNRVIIASNEEVKPELLSQGVELLQKPLAEYDVDLEKTVGYLMKETELPRKYRVLTDQYSPANLL
ncbi:spermidine synthase [Thalassotalea crassostreae]|uniref:spermidine synthase n=1 Tax=Thalassotalea crassostreae TaxID=1763536 RepID=UPI0009EDF886|nr:fused MFS/spermidine synthase [Thalassotalea crassostreae]